MMKKYLPRQLLKRVQASLLQFPAVAILGARQVGKTTLARELARQGALFLDLEKQSDLNHLDDSEAYLESQAGRLVVLDEVQRKPEIFRALRPLIDENRKPGRFLILGSASPELLKQSSESLAGRIEYLELGPLSLAELGAKPGQWKRHWLRGGFPDSLLAADDAASMRWRKAFISTHLERDVPGFGIRVPASALMRFWTMLAH